MYKVVWEHQESCQLPGIWVIKETFAKKVTFALSPERYEGISAYFSHDPLEAIQRIEAPKKIKTKDVILEMLYCLTYEKTQARLPSGTRVCTGSQVEEMDSADWIWLMKPRLGI